MPRDPMGDGDSFGGGYAWSLTESLRRELRGWLLLAVGALAVAGVLAGVLAASRTPGVQDWLPGGDFFRRALVGHVVLSFVVWYLALLGGLSAAAMGRGPAPGRWAALGPLGLGVAVLGTVVLLAPIVGDRGAPVLSNYVPVLAHPLYFAGLALVAGGVAAPVVRLLANPKAVSAPVEQAVAVAGAGFLAALACVGLAWMGRPAGVGPFDDAEVLFWGGGHVLQLVNTVLAMAAWQGLGEHVLGAEPLPRRLFHATLTTMLAAAGAAPLFYAVWAPDAVGLHQAFTALYWVAVPLPPVVLGAAAARGLWRRRHDVAWRAPACLGLASSLALFALGGLLGFAADGADARTPAHYHAVIGGVNLAFMGLILGLLLPLLGRPPRPGRWLTAQFWLYGAGQAAFVAGMFLAGNAGVPRKAAGAAAQGLDSLAKQAAMGLTGLGGAVAVAGGVAFVATALALLLRRDGAQG